MTKVGIDEMGRHAAEFIRGLRPKPEGATVVALSGDLGAGKTTFVQGAAHALGVEETVTSPTFVLEKIYALDGQSFLRLVHIDAYRLKGTHELEILGWRELLEDAGNLILIEWPERVAEAIPDEAVRLNFSIDGEGRIITIDGTHSTSSGHEEKSTK